METTPDLPSYEEASQLLIVRDITRISEAEMDTSLADPEEAKALIEIVEYLRVGVQRVFEELQPPRPSLNPAPSVQFG